MRVRFVRQFARSPKAVCSALILAAFIVSGLFAPRLAPHDPERQDLSARLRPPHWSLWDAANYPLGTDGLGRDMLSRLLYGARVSLVVGILGAVASMAVGLPLGLVAGYFRGWTDDLVMRVVDIFLAIPALVIAIALVAILKPNLATIVLAFTIATWAWVTRTLRAEVLGLRERDFVEAARAIGAGEFYIIRRYIFANVMNTALVLATMYTPLVILWEASLAFLGLGSSLSWGWDLAYGKRYLAVAWWIATFPGLAIFLVVLSLNLFGDWIRDYLDVRVD
jgi:peptide/nickel transport system permease protein